MRPTWTGVGTGPQYMGGWQGTMFAPCKQRQTVTDRFAEAPYSCIGIWQHYYKSKSPLQLTVHADRSRRPVRQTGAGTSSNQLACKFSAGCQSVALPSAVPQAHICLDKASGSTLVLAPTSSTMQRQQVPYAACGTSLLVPSSTVLPSPRHLCTYPV